MPRLTDVFGGGFLSPAGGAPTDMSAQQKIALAEAIQSGQNGGGPNPFNDEEMQALLGQGALNRNKAAALEGMTPEEQAKYQQAEAQNERFGSDMSWLDPSFQYSPELLGQSAGSQAAADPAAVAAQNAAMQQAQQMASSNLQFQSPDQQNALMQQWAQVQGGQGQPSFMGNGTQQALMQQLLGVKAPSFSGDADQRAVLNQALGMATNSGPGSLTFDTSGRQGEQYGNLQDIIKGGGATAIEMADRQRARADSESWLRGQREADMADYAERGLTGSGMELLNLAADRQSAAGRNSQADLDMAKALEERRLGAINSASGLATNMRGQTVDEQGLLNNRSMTGLNVAGSVTNSMRDADIREQLGLNEAARAQITGAADITNQMRTSDYNELSYNDKRMMDALKQQTDLSSKTRDQTYQEQVGNRNALQSSLDTFANTSANARQSSAQESQYRATAADDFSVKNNAAINKAKDDNTSFLQDAYVTTQGNRTQVGINDLNQKLGAAAGQQARDIGETAAGFDQAQRLGFTDAATWNAMSQELRDKILGVVQGEQSRVAGAQAAGNAAAGQIAGAGVQGAGTAIGAIIGGAGAGSAAGGATAAQGATAGAQAGSQALTQSPPLIDNAEAARRKAEASRKRANFAGL